MTNISGQRTLELSQTIAAPLRRLDETLDKAALLPSSRRFGGTSVLPRVARTGDQLNVETGAGPRYVPLRELGVGGMGEVALVEDRDIGRKVARKRLLPGSGAPDVMRFVDEVHVVGKLDHPGIVPIHDVGLDDQGEFFYVMKYVEGETLESVVERIRAEDPATLATWTPTHRVSVIVSLLRALDYAHEKGILHRDLKPANVMLGKYGEVMLMDWGVARPIGGLPDAADPAAPSNSMASRGRVASTHAGTLVGTPIFMSPEQATGATDALDGRSDLYAVGLMLHELMAGSHLHDGIEDLNTLLVRAMRMEAPSAFALTNQGISPDLSHFLHKALQHAPANRWQTAGEMADELEAILDGRCAIQCPMTLTKRSVRGFARFVDRRPFLAVAAVLTGLTTFVSLGVFAFLHGR